jgi:hypothetical protein
MRIASRIGHGMKICVCGGSICPLECVRVGIVGEWSAALAGRVFYLGEGLSAALTRRSSTILASTRAGRRSREEKCEDEDQELQEAGRVGGVVFCGAGDGGGAAAGAALGRIGGVRLYGGAGERANCAGAGEVHNVPRGRGVFVLAEGQPQAVSGESV